METQISFQFQKGNTNLIQTLSNTKTESREDGSI